MEPDVGGLRTRRDSASDGDVWGECGILFHFLHSPTVDIAYSLQRNISGLREVGSLLEIIYFIVQDWYLGSDPRESI